MRILFIGRGQPYEVNTFLSQGIQSLNHELLSVNFRKYYPTGKTKLERFYIKVFDQYLSKSVINNNILRQADIIQPHIVFVVKGSKITKSTLITLKHEFGCQLVNYATDDPFNKLVCSDEIRDCIPLFDLYACTKRAIMQDVINAGGKKVSFIPFGYQPDYHFPEKPILINEPAKYDNEVVFIGTADSSRRKMLYSLIKEYGLDIKLFGGYWDEYPELRAHHRGFVYGKNYRFTLGTSKIALGLVRQSNRDGHSPRSFEIPACGAFLLAEETNDHLEFFRPGIDAVLFSSTEDLYDKATYYLVHDNERNKIAISGYEHITKYGNNSYRDRADFIISLL